MASTITRYAIDGGPDKSEFFTSLSYGSSDSRINIALGVIGKSESTGIPNFTGLRNFIINSASREDGSGKKWLFEGYFVNVLGPARKVKGYYDLNTRKGWVDIEFP